MCMLGVGLVYAGLIAALVGAASLIKPLAFLGIRTRPRGALDSKHLPSPARRGSRSRTASPPRPLRFARLRVPVWNPYSRGRLSPAKSEDRKGGEGKTDGKSCDAAKANPCWFG